MIKDYLCKAEPFRSPREKAVVVAIKPESSKIPFTRTTLGGRPAQ